MASMIAKWEQKDNGQTFNWDAGSVFRADESDYDRRMSDSIFGDKRVWSDRWIYSKREAAKKTGCKLVVIERPLKEEGISLEELMKQLGGEDEENCNCWSWNGKLEDADCGSEGTNPAGTAFDWSKRLIEPFSHASTVISYRPEELGRWLSNRIKKKL